MKKIKELKVYAGMLALAASTLVGCANNKKNTVSQEPTKIVTEVTETPTNTVTPTPVIEETKTVTEPYFAISAMGSLEHSQYDRILSLSKEDIKYYIGEDELRKFDIKCTPSEYSLLKGTGIAMDFAHSYASLDKNTKLSETENQYLREGIKNLEIKYSEGNLPNMPLAPLDHTLENCEVKYVYDEADYRCKFNPFECCVYINTRLVTTEYGRKYALMKGVFGYGSTEVYDVIDGKTVLSGTFEYVFLNSTDGSIINMQKLGERFEKGLAEILAAIAMDEKYIRYTNPEVEHMAEAEILGVYLYPAKMTIGDYATNGYYNYVRSTPVWMPQSELPHIEEYYSQFYPDKTEFWIGDRDNVVSIADKKFVQYLDPLLLCVEGLCRVIEANGTDDLHGLTFEDLAKNTVCGMCHNFQGYYVTCPYEPEDVSTPVISGPVIEYYLDMQVDAAFKKEEKSKEKAINRD